MKKFILLFLFVYGKVYSQQIDIPDFTKNKTHWKDVRKSEADAGATIPFCGLIRGFDYIDYGSSSGPLTKELYCNGVQGSRNLTNNISYKFDLQTNERDGDDTKTALDFVQQFDLTWSCETKDKNAVQLLNDLYDRIAANYKMKSTPHKYKDFSGQKAEAFSKRIYLIENKKTGKTLLLYNGLVDGVGVSNYMTNKSYLKPCDEVKNLDKK